MDLPAISIHLSNHGPAQATVDDVVKAEAHGARRVWLSEDLFYRGAIPIAAAAFARTSTIEIGFGVLAAQHRHPASISMDLRSLLELGPHRLTVGVGAGVAERAALIGKEAKPPLRIVDETVAAVKTLLDGGVLAQNGVLHTSSGLQLTGDELGEIPPVYVAAVGPKALAQAGRGMDGVVLTMMCSIAHAQWAVRQVTDAANLAGRGPVPIVAYLPIAVDSDGARAKERMRQILGGFIARWSTVAFLSRLFLDWSDMNTELMAQIREAVGAGTPLQDLVPNDLVDQYCISGTPDECVRLMEGFGAAGVTEIALDAGDELDDVLRFLAGLGRDYH